MSAGKGDTRFSSVIQWAMMVVGFALIAGVIFREATLLLAGDTTTVTFNWPFLAVGAILFLGGLSCWFCPKPDHMGKTGSDNDGMDR